MCSFPSFIFPFLPPSLFLMVKMLPYCLFCYLVKVIQNTIFAVHILRFAETRDAQALWCTPSYFTLAARSVTQLASGRFPNETAFQNRLVIFVIAKAVSKRQKLEYFGRAS